MKNKKTHKKDMQNEGIVSNIARGIKGALTPGQTAKGAIQQGKGKDTVSDVSKPIINMWNMSIGAYPVRNTTAYLKNYAGRVAAKLSKNMLPAAELPDPTDTKFGLKVNPLTDTLENQKGVDKYLQDVVAAALTAQSPQQTGNQQQASQSAAVQKSTQQTQTNTQAKVSEPVDMTAVQTEFLKLSPDEIRQLLKNYRTKKGLFLLGITAESRMSEISKSSWTLFESVGLRDHYFETWSREIFPGLIKLATLTEGTTLTPDQITKLFTATQAAAGRTGLGKTVDTVKAGAEKLGDVWFNKFGSMLKNSTPVKNFDASFDKLKTDIAAKNPEIAAKLAKYGDFAKNHPNWHKFLLAVAGSVAAALGVAAAGGISAGALAVGTGAGVATGIINITDRLLQGQQASTAIGRGATAGLTAGLTAAGVTALAQWAAHLAVKVADVVGSTDIKTLKVSRTVVGYAPNMPGYPIGFEVTGKTADLDQLNSLWNQYHTAAEAFSKTNNAQSVIEPYQKFTTLMDKMTSSSYIDSLNVAQNFSDKVYQQAANARQAIKQVWNLASSAGAAAAGQASASTSSATTESLSRKQAKLIVEFLNKVSSKDLIKKWKAAGSPTDSDEIARIMTDAGVTSEVLAKVFSDLGIALPAKTTPSTPTTVINLEDEFLKLSVDDIKNLLAFYKKSKAMPKLGITLESKINESKEYLNFKNKIRRQIVG